MRSKIEKFSLIACGAIIGVLISLNLPVFADKVEKSNLPIDELRTFAEVFGKIKSDYVEPVEDKKLINEALNGMLTGLDPHSSFLNMEDFKDLNQATQGEFGGLGLEVGTEDGFVKVISPIEDSPAYKAGLKSGDLIMKIDGASTKGLTLNDSVKKMRGKPGSKITLTVLRKSEVKPLIFNLVRAIIKSQSVKGKLAEPNYVYVRVSQFQEHTGEDLAKLLKSLREQNKVPFKGILLDLRNNPGGLLNSAVGVSAAFLPKDNLVVYTEGRAADSRMHLTAIPENYLKGGNNKDDYLKDLPEDIRSTPMVVLVNNGSASASEIVAGALQDHKRALIVGMQSFGKGSVQSILPMNNGTAIKMTTARYFTPNGRSIQAKGIVPDIIVDDGSDPSFMTKEADLTNHLSNPKDADANAPAKDNKTSPSPIKKPEEEKKKNTDTSSGPIEPASKADKQFQEAMNILKGLQILQNK
ncbi:MAG: S41 family peptidase [Candidatus Methylopumilus sp.]|nr:S41 family peptidase [Candidatus Methylopumilus sp.]